MAIAAIVHTVAQRQTQANLSELEDWVRRYVLLRFAETGQPPELADLQREFQLGSVEEASAILRKLDGADLIVYQPTAVRIIAAYPFSAEPTAHQVEIGRRVLHALCAIDALGIPSMLDASAVIRSQCFWCHAPVEVRVHNGRVAQHQPTALIVWYPEKESCDCVATSRCVLINFFCSADDLAAWREANPDERGIALTLEEALEAGRIIFGNLLR